MDFVYNLNENEDLKDEENKLAKIQKGFEQWKKLEKLFMIEMFKFLWLHLIEWFQHYE